MIVFDDPLIPALRILREWAASKPETASIVFGTEYPEDLSSAPSLPYAALSLDGTDNSLYPYRRESTLRITVWASSKAKTYRLASLLQAVLSSYDGLDIATARAGNIFASRDPDSNAPITSAIVWVTQRPTEA